MQEEWAKELERAFAPYTKFVEDIFDGLQEVSNETTGPSLSRVNRDPKTVLMIDKIEVNRVLFGHYFKRYPVQVEYASSLDVAWACLQKKHVDLVIVDVAFSLEFEKMKSPVPFMIVNPKETSRERLVNELARTLWS